MPTPTPRIVWLTMLASLAAKILVVGWTQNLELILDESDYVDHAQYLLAHGYLPDAFRPPVYPIFVALCQLVGGDTATPVRIGQALLTSAAGLILYRWLRTHVGHSGAFLSASLWFLYPTFVGYTHLLWTESVFLSLLIFFFATSLTRENLSLRRTAWAAFIFGLAALTRSVLLPLLPLAAIFVLLHTHRWAWRSQPIQRFVLFVGIVAMTVLPWTIHNRVVEGRWILNETTNGYNLWKGNTPWVHPYATEGPQYPGPVVSIPMYPYEGSGQRLTKFCETEVVDEPYTLWHVSQCAKRLAVGHIIDDPLVFLARGPKKLGVAFHPSNLLQRHMWLGHYGTLSTHLQQTILWGTTLPYFGLLAIMSVAIRKIPRTPLTAALGLLALYQIAVIFITFGNTRFRLPVMLIGVIFAAWIPKRSIGTET